MLILSPDIRHLIWQHLFKRPTGIVPGLIHTTKESFPDQRYYKAWKRYHYQWSDARQYRVWVEDLPIFYPHILMEVSWITKSSFQQREMIKNGMIEHHRASPSRNRPVTPGYELRHDGSVDIVNIREERVHRLPSLNVARACKQLHDEVCQVLYGENTFVLDARGKASIGQAYGRHSEKDFAALCRRLPVLFDESLSVINQRALTAAVEYIFDTSNENYYPQYLWRDPVTRFFRTIGKVNAARLRKVEIQGLFKKYSENPDDKRPLGLARLLPLYTKIFSRACCSIRTITIDMTNDDDVLYMDGGLRPGAGTVEVEYFDHFPGTESMTEEEKIDVAIRKLVEGLPNLEHLQLGAFRKSTDEDEDPWGKSVRWMKVVADRSMAKTCELLAHNTTSNATIHGEGQILSNCEPVEEAEGDFVDEGVDVDVDVVAEPGEEEQRTAIKIVPMTLALLLLLMKLGRWFSAREVVSSYRVIEIPLAMDVAVEKAVAE